MTDQRSAATALGGLVEALLDEQGLRLSPRLADALESAQDSLRHDRKSQRFAVVTLAVSGEDDEEAIASALADDLRDAGWSPLGISLYQLGKGRG